LQPKNLAAPPYSARPGGYTVSDHIDDALRDWDYEPGPPQARLTEGHDGRQVLQLRMDLGVLQMEMTGRPDGARPFGFATYFDHLRHEARKAARADKPFTLDEEQCRDADREFVQFYHRRVSWLQLKHFRRAVADADHTLAFMDFVKEHSPSAEYTEAHERYRGFVTFQRTQAAAALALEDDDPEKAIDEVRHGLDRLKAFFAEHGLEEQLEDDGMVQHLRRIEQSLRQEHDIKETLQEQLDRAIANEEYETAARLRDRLRERQ
jgi:hypothetical protein